MLHWFEYRAVALLRRFSGRFGWDYLCDVCEHWSRRARLYRR